MGESPQAPVADPLANALRWTAMCCLAGTSVALWSISACRAYPNANIFYVLFARYELYFLVLAPLSLYVAYWIANRIKSGSSRSRLTECRWLVPVIAVLVLVVCWAGSYFVYHRHPFSMDEYGAEFQAEIFLSGRIFAPVEEKWQPFAQAMTPIFVNYHSDGKGWISQYLPVYSALRVPFMAIGDSWLLNPILSALSVIAVALLARMIWPERREAAVVAAILLASSSQFLATGMSAYAYPAHLCLNLWWLYLYVRNTQASLLIAPWLGVVALGLHQPVVHAVFVAPFLLRLLLQRRWSWVAYMGVVYALGLAAWIAWLRMTRPELDSARLQSVFGLPNTLHLINQAMSLSLLVTWQPLMFVLALIGIARLRGQPVVVWDLALSFVLTFGFYVFYLRNQGHGWGYRYCHAVLGNLALLATLGWFVLGDSFGTVRAGRILVAGVALSLALFLLRCWEVEREVRPFAQGQDHLLQAEGQIVVFDPTALWYGEDLIRNDPLLRRGPIILSSAILPPDQLYALKTRYTVRTVPPEQLAEFGLRPIDQ